MGVGHSNIIVRRSEVMALMRAMYKIGSMCDDWKSLSTHLDVNYKFLKKKRK